MPPLITDWQPKDAPQRRISTCGGGLQAGSLVFSFTEANR